MGPRMDIDLNGQVAEAMGWYIFRPDQLIQDHHCPALYQNSRLQCLQLYRAGQQPVVWDPEHNLAQAVEFVEWVTGYLKTGYDIGRYYNWTVNYRVRFAGQCIEGNNLAEALCRAGLAALKQRGGDASCR